MEKRKIQRTGGSSFSITLPKRWIEENKVKEQDVIVLSSLRSGTLIVRSFASLEKQIKRKHDITGLTEEEIRREVIALYILGIEEVKIFAETISQKQRLAVREVIRLLIGFEIIEESSNAVYIKNVLNSQKLSLIQSIEKMFSMAQSMIQDAAASLLEGKKPLAQDVIERDGEIDKLYFLVLRYNNALLQGKISEEELDLTFTQSHYYEGIATQLERIADHAVKIASVVRFSEVSVKGKLEKLFRNSALKFLWLLQNTANLINSRPDSTQVHKMMNKILEAEKDIDLFRKETTKSNFSEMLIISDSIDRLHGYLLNIAEALIDQSVIEEISKR